MQLRGRQAYACVTQQERQAHEYQETQTKELRFWVKGRCPGSGPGEGERWRGVGMLSVSEDVKGRVPAGGKRDGNI